MYPFAIILEFILVPLILSIQGLSAFSLYLVALCALVMMVFAAITTPYNLKSGNVRLLLNRSLVLCILAIQIAFKSLKTSTLPPHSSFLNQIPFVLLSLLLLGVVCNGAYICRNTYLWYKKSGIIDINMFVEQKGTIIKEDLIPVPRDPHKQQLSYPKQEYSKYNKPRDGIYTPQQVRFLRNIFDGDNWERPVDR